MRVHFLVAAVAASAHTGVLADPCDTQGPSGEQMYGPSGPDQWKDWLSGLKQFREQCLDSINYNASIYDYDELTWTQQAFMQPQMHPYDRFFYTKEKGYDVQGWLDDLNTRYGGIDAALIWPTYTNIGVDDRSQFQQITSMPGGIDAISKFAAELHDANVKVLWPYNPWDTGTHRDDQGRTDAELLAWLCNATNTEGFNGDTMGSVPEEFFQASLDVGHPIAIEPEGGGIAQSLNWDTMGWGYWNYQSVAPHVSKWKWLEPRFTTNVCDRWNKNKTDNLQYAWFNGAGYETWENVWGTWNGIVPADGEAIRRVGTMLRFFGARGFTASADWTPYFPTVQSDSVFATQFPLGVESLWTLVNRGGLNTTGAQLVIPSTSQYGASANSLLSYYDCYHGTQLQPKLDDDKNMTFSFDIEVNGYGCVFATASTADTSSATDKLAVTAPEQPQTLDAFLATMRSITARKLSSYRKDWTYLLQTIVPSPTTKPTLLPKEGMKRCPGGLYHFITQGVEIEGGPVSGVDTQFAWEMHPSKSHDAYMYVDSFDIDEYPVTVREYAEYLKESKYLPTNAHNWLKDSSWKWPEGKGPIVGPYGHGPATVAPHVSSLEVSNRPVVWVSLQEARDYCAHYGKRLPQVWEWQYAAQGGNETYNFPWGSDDDTSRYPSTVNTGTTTPARESVLKYGSKGESPFGVKDLIGNVWQFTSEVQDPHTRGVLVKGSANYRPDASHWYFPQALQLNTHNKYFLMDDSYERSGTIGFRCAADAPTDTPKSEGRDCKPTSSSPLCARVDYTPGYVDVSALGTSDWIHFGVDGNCPTCPTRKASPGSKGTVSNVSVCDGCSPPQQFTNNLAAFSWTDGSPSTFGVVANTTTGVFVENDNGGVAAGQLTARAEAGVTATADLFLGLFSTQATFSAALLNDDGDSVTDFSQTLSAVQGASVATNARFTFRFEGPATLIANWTALPPPVCTDNLCASSVVTQQCGSTTGSQIDLTNEGHDDWIHFQDDVSGDGVTRKASGGSQIKANTLDGKSPKTFSNDAVTFSWNDGDHTEPTSGGSTTGVYVEGQNQGFTITLPVGTNGDALAQVWLGAYNGDGFVTAELSDGSAPAVNMTISCHQNSGGRAVALQIKNAAQGSTVKVTFTQTSDEGNITLEAAAVTFYGSESQLEAATQRMVGGGDGGGNVNFQAATISVE